MLPVIRYFLFVLGFLLLPFFFDLLYSKIWYHYLSIFYCSYLNCRKEEDIIYQNQQVYCRYPFSKKYNRNVWPPDLAKFPSKQFHVSPGISTWQEPSQTTLKKVCINLCQNSHENQIIYREKSLNHKSLYPPKKFLNWPIRESLYLQKLVPRKFIYISSLAGFLSSNSDSDQPESIKGLYCTRSCFNPQALATFCTNFRTEKYVI